MLVKPDRAVDSHAHSDCDHRNLHRRPADDQLHCHSVDHHDRRHVHSQLDSALRVRESSPSWSEPVRHASAVKRKLPGAAELARLSDRDWDRQLRGQERRYRYTYSHNSDGQSKGNADACGSANGIAVANVWHDVPSDQEERRRDGVLRELQRERNGIYVSGVVRMLLGIDGYAGCLSHQRHHLDIHLHGDGYRRRRDRECQWNGHRHQFATVSRQHTYVQPQRAATREYGRLGEL